ncbi:MAG: heme-binding domain-containing protein [Deltaproteobacteria bacterium]|nr:heme-binding domain-containing protein [Deltaproteobacteria bacterium]
MSEDAARPRRRWPRRLALGLGLCLLLAQLIRPARTNPPEQGSAPLDGADAHTRLVLERACLDCHSNRTRWPWYSNVAPVSWLVIHDVNEGRENVNFSEWSRVSPEERGKLLDESCAEVREGEMPPFTYGLVHRDAHLDAADVAAICAWARDTGARAASE